jgi:hypothetical protein|tara:strand:+ start:1091 stop:1276 length:186 start_codon:yes stop_codon:yes gene_type:complete
MSIIDDIIEIWSDLIDSPLAINKKQGFLLKNGMRIIFNESGLLFKSKKILSRHYLNPRRKS